MGITGAKLSRMTDNHAPNLPKILPKMGAFITKLPHVAVISKMNAAGSSGHSLNCCFIAAIFTWTRADKLAITLAR
jgi:hypothetical protein